MAVADGEAGARPLYERVLAGDRPLGFGLVGGTLGHSHSPAIHERLGSVPYDLVEVPADRVGEFFASRAYRGLNVTIPYKRAAAAAADELSPAAERLGNANTLVVRPDGALFADNTDYHGFLRLVASTGVEVRGLACLVLGDGGAAATVRAALSDLGAAEVITASRRGPLTFTALAGDPGVPRDARDEAAAVLARTGFVVNATPVGMFPHADDPQLVDLGRFPRLEGACDLVYNPLRTRFVQRARELGVPAEGGLAMLVAQAKRSSDLFLGISDRPDDVERGVFADLRRSLSTVSLIGMPGCGKTRAGSALASLLGFEFVDVDALVERMAGRPIPEIFAQDGEAAFRALETRATSEACSRGGRVVACGGGVVTRPENLPLLRQNGPVVLLTRGLDAADGEVLATEGRPVSQGRGVDALRAERAPLYHAWADVEVGPAPEGPSGTAATVLAELSSRGLL